VPDVRRFTPSHVRRASLRAAALLGAVNLAATELAGVALRDHVSPVRSAVPGASHRMSVSPRVSRQRFAFV